MFGSLNEYLISVVFTVTSLKNDHVYTHAAFCMSI